MMRARRGSSVFHFLARARQRFLALGARFQGVLQAGLGCGGIQLCQIAHQLFQFDRAALALVGGQLLVALQVGDADLDAALGELRFLSRALQLAQARAGGFCLGGQRFAVDLGVGETGLVLGQFLVQGLETGFGLFAGPAAGARRVHRIAQPAAAAASVPAGCRAPGA
ncbi:hypothetical protein G6F22_019053 [Rhizopus arrhizus]|nr:hypothetical protein G6F22_019053 [Rhizopus arrhizus]